MKKRIIALILALVMAVLALASCGSAFSFAEEDLSQYATFDLAGFKAALQKIEIEDGDFTTDEATRQKKVQNKIYTALVNAITGTVEDGEKLEEGTISERDVVYFCYYTSFEKDGKTYVFSSSEMNESTVASGSTKDSHVVKLAIVDLTDEDADELQKALKTALTGVDVTDAIYSTVSTKNKVVNNGIVFVKDADGKDTSTVDKYEDGDTIVISYSREYVVNEIKKDSEGNPVIADDTTPEANKVLAKDEDGNVIKDGENDVYYVTEPVTYKETALYETITLNGESENALAKKLAAADATVKVGNNVKFGTKESFEVVDGDITYTYSAVNVKWIVEKEGVAVEFKHTPYDNDQKVEPDNVHLSSAEKINLKDVELTYHVFPVYYLSVPEISATSIVKEIFGKNISTASLELFEDETYKNGEETLEDMIKVLSMIWSGNYDEESEDATIKNLIALKKTYTDLEEEYDGSDGNEDLGNRVDAAEKAWKDAVAKAKDDQISKLLAATSTAEGAKSMSDAIVEEYTDDTYHSLKEAYDEEIVEAVGKEIYLLLEKYVTLTGKYPEKLVEEYYDHLYESYEYDFYKGYVDDTQSKGSNYKAYNGNFEAFLLEETGATESFGGDIEKAITAKAKSYIDPIIRVYVVAKALEADALAVLPGYLESDITTGAYDANYEDDATEDEKAEADKKAEENIAELRENITKFIVTDKVFDEYKKDLGKVTYKDMEKRYGEINIRTSLQFTRLFYYLTCTDIEKPDDHVEIKYTEDGKYLSFRTVSYTIKVETTDGEGEGEGEGSN